MQNLSVHSMISNLIKVDNSILLLQILVISNYSNGGTMPYALTSPELVIWKSNLCYLKSNIQIQLICKVSS